MSYARKDNLGSNRTVAIFIVAIIHAIVGYALVTGLAYNVVKKAAEELKTFDVEEEPPPPPEEPPPPPPEQVPETPPPVVVPPPIVRTNPTPPPVIQSVPVAPPPVITPRAPVAPPAPPAPPPPPPVKTVPPRSAVGNLQGLFSGDDYPASALDREEEGSVSVRLSIGTNGRVTNCSVTRSSGSRTLDSTTCRILSSRARFTPGTDNRGNPTTDTVQQTIRWVLQG